MNIELRLVPLDEREILLNLLEKYEYEFSQYNNRDVNKLGLYAYPYLDYYWIEKNRWAYFIEVDGKLAGFVMVHTHPYKDTETDFNLAEFFVMYAYRRSGIGKEAFFKTLDIHKGQWQLAYIPKNEPSAHFWHKAVDEYTKGEYELVKSHPNAKHIDGSLCDVFFFKS
ncbi:MAG: GNAT family N-acetyltransferase [Defluviitaleaceae bacterium]|nr:GNAT family N-acetyltransferase [Defluviitaleaceae bacterium]